MITRTSSIPIMLLTGFLGAGKTSLLNHVLASKEGLKIGVIVNDFGDINIDSLLVSAQTDTQLELSNGCICCSVDESELDDAISQLAHKGSLLDYIVIEASGLAEPKDLATMLRLMKNKYAHFDSIVTVIDADNFEQNNKTHPTAVENLAIADIIVINKVDLVTNKKLDEIKAGIELVSENARIIETENGQVDSRLLVTKDISNPQSFATEQLSLQPDEHNHEHLHDKFSSVSFEAKEPLDPCLFETWAEELPANIFRAKGICYFGMKGVEQKFIFQSVGKRYKLKLDEWAHNEVPSTKLVVIGTNMDDKAVKKRLENLIDKTPDGINQETLMDIFKYK